MGALCGACHHACMVSPAPTRSRADKSMSAHPGQCGCTSLGLLCGLRCGLLRRLLLRQLRRLLLLLLRTRTARRRVSLGSAATQCCVIHARLILNPAWHAGLDPHLLLLLRGLRGGRLRRCGRLLLRRRQRHARRARRACAEGAVRVSFAPLLALRAPAAATPCAIRPRGPSTQRGCRGERRKEACRGFLGRTRRARRGDRAGLVGAGVALVADACALVAAAGEARVGARARVRALRLAAHCAPQRCPQS